MRSSLGLVFALAGTALGIAVLNTTAQVGADQALAHPGARVGGVTMHEPSGRRAPAWHNSSWLNTPEDRPLTLESLRGQVVLLNFWTFSCWNCTGLIPSLVQYDSLYRERGLTIIGMHRPEFGPYAGEHDRKNVAAALTRYHIAYANAQDNDSATWDLYRIQAWPSYVLIDKRGVIRWEGAGEFHVGDGDHRLWDQRIRQLLAE